jgi:FAD-dependent urate hydroxylase
VTQRVKSGEAEQLAEFGSSSGPPVLDTVWRTDLSGVLYDEAVYRGVEVEFGKRLIRLDDKEDGVTAHFSDGSSATGDILVGADGIRSAVRPLIDPAAPSPRYTGLLAFAGRPTPGTTVDLPSTRGSLEMIYGKRAVFAYGVYDDGSFGWFVNLPSPKPITGQEARDIGAAEWTRRLAGVFAEDRSPAVELITASDPGEMVIVGALEDLPRVPAWSRGRVVLVGDAAHATSPSSGQGASIAIESAVQLARCLRDSPSHAIAFGTYEELRRSRVERIIASGAKVNSKKAPGALARALRDMFLPIAMKLLVKPERMAWQINYRIDWNETVRRVPTQSPH